MDRGPGLVRNCGGLDHEPTAQPLQLHVNRQGELVAFTPQYGASTPAGEGAEAVLDWAHRVV
jgi:hypothetical protein